jgi:N utilization substance protein B
MSRILARENCFKLMFEYEFLKERNELSLLSFLESENLTEEEKFFVQNEYDGLIEKNTLLEGIIAKHLKGYTLNRIFKVDLAILKVAVFEMLFSNEKTPSKVIINEAVELAKKYSTDKSYKFVNGVLASINKGEMDGKTAD